MAIHIIFLHKHFPFGGAERVTLDIANELCAHGYEVTVLATRYHPESYPTGLQPRFKVVELPHGNVKYSPRVARFVRDYIREHAVTAFVSYRELLYASWLKRQTGAAYIFALQSMPLYEMSHASWIARQFYLNKYRRILRTADLYGVLCEGNRQRLISTLGLEDEAAKLHVLPNSIKSNPNVVWEKRKEAIFVGRLSRRDKRVDRLLRIWAEAESQLPDWTLRIVGDGPERQALQTLASELHLQRVHFEGFHTNVQPYYDAASVLCMTSSFEGWPLVVAEAQSNGVVPIAFNSFDSAPEIIATQDEGVLVAPFDEQAFAQELIVLAQDTERLKRMSKAVVVKAATYSIDRTFHAWLQMLSQLPTVNSQLSTPN